VADVLGYVGFDRRDLLARVRRAVEAALKGGALTLRESRLFLHDYERGLAGTTYLEDEEAEAGPVEPAKAEADPHERQVAG
jgi:arginine decarboxylase